MSKGGYHGGSTVVHGNASWVGGGSVTSQPTKQKAKEERLPKRGSRKKPKKKARTPAKVKTRSNGLTIPEQITAAERKVATVKLEIRKAEKDLAQLKRKLGLAQDKLKQAQHQPRKTALGDALYRASEAGDENG